MGKPTRVNLFMDEEVVKKAKELGLNLSKTCENCLKQAIGKMEELYGKTSDGNCSSDKGVVARERFELSSAGPEPAMLGHYIRREEILHPPPGFCFPGCLKK